MNVFSLSFIKYKKMVNRDISTTLSYDYQVQLPPEVIRSELSIKKVFMTT